MNAILSLVIVSGVAFNAASAYASDTANEKTAPAKRKIGDPTKNRAFAIPKEITLTSDQTAKLNEIKKEHASKLAQLLTERRDLLTNEQKSARTAMMVKARADNVTGKERP